MTGEKDRRGKTIKVGSYVRYDTANRKAWRGIVTDLRFDPIKSETIVEVSPDRQPFKRVLRLSDVVVIRTKGRPVKKIKTVKEEESTYEE